ncbi:MAG: Crp/Fnr family transcriptional regulator [Acetobacteraceae bacterium]|nr:Crp/Fnr family transcriptional regulator [Acetobacteraceae bacterium]
MRSHRDSLRNRFLMAIPPEILARLSAQLERVALQRRAILIEPGVSPSQLYFLDYGLVSLVKTMSDGRTAEVGTVGPEGMVGVAILVGMTQPMIEAQVQVDGSAHRLRTAALVAEVEQSPPLRELVLRYLRYEIDLAAQRAACNRLHTLRQRCCRWLLAAHDSAETPTFTVTHEFLALMMGVNRARLSMILRTLQHAGAISYRYASVTIADRAALEDGSCECYETLRREAHRIYQS